MIASTLLKLCAASLIGAAVLAPVSADLAEAGYKKGKRHYSTARGYDRHDYRYERRGYAEREYDRARADSVDPSGAYRGYPDWARYALSPKSDR